MSVEYWLSDTDRANLRCLSLRYFFNRKLCMNWPGV